MTEERRARRFSLQQLALFLTFVAMVIGLVSLNHKNRQVAQENFALRTENNRLRDELGELSIEDSSLLHILQVKSGEQLVWKWRVWIPEGKEYKLRGDGGRIPKDDLPSEGGTIWLREPGECVVEYKIEQDPTDKKWYGSLLTRGGSVGKDLQEWVDWSSSSSTSRGVSSVTQSFPDDRQVIICRFLISQRDSTEKIEDPAAGFVIWLERVK